MKSFLLIVLSIITLFFNFYVFQSYRAELKFRSTLKEGSVLTYEETVKLFPFFPNISSVAIPIDFYKAIIAFREAKITEAFNHIDLANSVNSTTQVANALKGEFLLSLGFADSAVTYLKKAFVGWPKNLNHYDMYNKALARIGDTLEIAKKFSYIDSLVNKDPRYYKSYIENVSQAKLFHLITTYNDLANVSKEIIKGTWVRSYNFPNNEVVKDTSIMYEITSNNFKVLPDKLYKYSLDKDSIFLYFSNTNKLISKYKIQYSDSLKTLIFLDVPIEGGVQDQFFTKLYE